MNWYTFLFGAAVGMAVFALVLVVLLACMRRIGDEQRKANALVNELMADGNRLRLRRAVALERIAVSLEALAGRFGR